jgi:hypothetical protein
MLQSSATLLRTIQWWHLLYARFPPLIEVGSRFAIYFQNVNRLRTETTDLFKAVLEDDYDVIVLLEMSLVSSCHNEELFDARFFDFQM